jgi:hypothetical protein
LPQPQQKLPEAPADSRRRQQHGDQQVGQPAVVPGGHVHDAKHYGRNQDEQQQDGDDTRYGQTCRCSANLFRRRLGGIRWKPMI